MTDDTLRPEQPPKDDTDDPQVVGGRFELGRRVATRSMSRLYLAHDRVLKTNAAVKILTPAAHHLAAAEALASLQQMPVEARFRHSYLVRLLDRGLLGDRLWLAMEWVGGGTLLDLISQTVVSGEETLALLPSPDPPAVDVTGASSKPPKVGTLHLLHLLSEAAFGLGEAHRQGVVHLDLKPDNIMYEQRDATPSGLRSVEWRAWFGEEGRAGDALVPRIIDWGISQTLSRHAVGDTDGRVPGAPAYLAPERAHGGAVDVKVDVYALGAILHHILAGDRPFANREPAGFWRRCAREPPRHPPSLPSGVSLLMSADARCTPTRRIATRTASLLACNAACPAVGRLREAEVRVQKATDLRHLARDRRAKARRALENAPFGSRAEQHEAWSLEDEARDFEGEANFHETQWVDRVRAALTIDPELPEGLSRLIDWHSAQLLECERNREERGAFLALENLRTHVRRYDDLGVAPDETVRRAQRLLAGTAFISLQTQPPADISVAEVVMVHRQLTIQRGTFKAVGHGGLERHQRPMGRVVLKLEAQGHHPVLYPIHLQRGTHWHLTPPDDSIPTVLRLPPLGTLSAGEVYVAPGWCWVGGEAFACDAPEPGRYVWIDGFVIQVNPVTHGEWIGYLDALVADGLNDEAARRVPGQSSCAVTHRACVMSADGRYRLTGDRVEEMLKWPVSMISWFDAQAYAAWRARVEGVPWRLPCEWEFEKAARCNDDRRLPWGDHMEVTWTRVGGSTEALYQPAPVDAETDDVTVHGVRWTVGNMPTWCLDAWSFDGPTPQTRVRVPDVGADGHAAYRMLRGGAFTHPKSIVSGASRFAYQPNDRPTCSGVRLARSWPPTTRKE